MDEGCWITHTLPDQVVALHQQVHPPWVSTTESRCSLISPFPCMWILTASPALTEEVAQSQVRNEQIHLWKSLIIEIECCLHSIFMKNAT